MASERFKELNEIAKTLGMDDKERIKWVLKKEEEEKAERERLRKEEHEERLRKEEHEARLRKEEKEEEIRKENAAREERQREREFRKMELEMEQKKRDYELRMAEIGKSEEKQKANTNRKLPNFNQNTDEIDAYLHRFELHAMNCKWARKEWGANLQSCLTGKCLKVLETLSIDDANDYDILKKALLNAFQCNAEGFMNKFKTCKPEKDETFSTYLCRQAKLLDRWLELAEVDKSSPEELIDFFRRDQVYSVCHPGLVGHLKESQPKSCKELEDLAMKYQMAHPQHNLAKVIKDEPSYFGATGFQNRGRDMTRGGSFVRSFSAPAKNYFEQGSAVPKCSFCQKKGHHKSQCRMTRSTGVTCFKCHRVGHYANDCPQRNTDCAFIGVLPDTKMADIIVGNEENVLNYHVNNVVDKLDRHDMHRVLGRIKKGVG